MNSIKDTPCPSSIARAHQIPTEMAGLQLRTLDFQKAQRSVHLGENQGPLTRFKNWTRLPLNAKQFLIQICAQKIFFRGTIASNSLISAFLGQKRYVTEQLDLVHDEEYFFFLQ